MTAQPWNDHHHSQKQIKLATHKLATTTAIQIVSFKSWSMEEDSFPGTEISSAVNPFGYSAQHVHH